MRVKSEDRRQKILDVAEEVFSARGFDHCSMAEISARVGGSKATLYSYFVSKEILFIEVMHRLAAADIKPLFMELDSKQDMARILPEFGEKFLRFISHEKMITAHRVLFAESGHTDVGRNFYQRGPGEGIKHLALYMEQCMAAGKMRRADSQVAAAQLMALLKSEVMEPLLFDAYERTELPSIELAVARALDTFLRAYAV